MKQKREQGLYGCGIWQCALLCLVGLSGSSCSDGGDAPRVLTVFAASSLTEAFIELGEAFESEASNVEVRFAFAGSQVLRLQVEEGAPADVVASANPTHLSALLEQGLVAQPLVFAHNSLALIVPDSTVSEIATLADLPSAQRLVVGVKNVPIGAYTDEMLKRAEALYGRDYRKRVLASVVSEEKSVRLVRAKVALGEADAAIVYQSDVRGEKGVRLIPIPDSVNVVAEYPMAGVINAGHVELVNRWMRFVSSERARALLQKHGFGVP